MDAENIGGGFDDGLFIGFGLHSARGHKTACDELSAETEGLQHADECLHCPLSMGEVWSGR